MKPAVLDALGDPTRREVLEQLRNGPKPVAEVAAVMPISRPAVSQHLRVLSDAGLVTHDKRGRQHLYRIDTEALKELRDYIESFWTEALISFKTHIEKGGAP